MGSSSFSVNQLTFNNAERLDVKGATCDCYRVKYYSKLHFLKRLKPEIAGDPRYRALLTKEFEIGLSLEHSNLVRYVNKGDDFILMDYVDGDNLSTFIRRQPDYFRSKANRRKFAEQLLSVTTYLHSHQVVHLDIKPDNIMITRIGHDVKLVDLGFCYNDTYPDTPGHTKGFAAPEQQADMPQVDERTDIYAIGKVLALIPGGKEFKWIVKKCTLAHPSERFQTVEEIREKLKKKNWIQAAAIIAAMIAIGVVIALFTLNSKQGDDNKTTAALPSTDSLAALAKDSMTMKEGATETEQNESVNIQATPQPASPATLEITTSNQPAQTTVAEPFTPAPPKAQETAKPGSTTPEPVNQSIAVQQPEHQNTRQQTINTNRQSVSDDATSSEPKANPQKQQTSSKDVSAPDPAFANVEEKVIQEFKREIRPLVIRMEDEHIANGGFTESDGKRYHWVNPSYVQLRNSYTSKHFNPIKNKLINKYKRQLTDFEKYDLPQQFEIAISQVSNDYLRSIGYMH